MDKNTNIRMSLLIKRFQPLMIADKANKIKLKDHFEKLFY